LKAQILSEYLGFQMEARVRDATGAHSNELRIADLACAPEEERLTRIERI
jgi:hypothetical protein